jgi:hypothetical protein
MASPCLGCGTTTDANGDLTINGARSSAWKSRYGPDIDASNGLRCDPTSGKLWVAPPMKTNTWTLGVGSWISGLVNTGTWDARSYWVGGRTVNRVPANEGAIAPAAADPQSYTTKQYVATGSTFNWTNTTAEEQILQVYTHARLGAGTLYAGGVLTTARGMAGCEVRVNINNEGNLIRTIEHGLYHGSSLQESNLADNVLPFSVTHSDCSRTDVFTVEAGQTVQVVLKPYYRCDFGNENLMVFIFDYAPKAVITATSLFRHHDGLDDA